MGLHAVELRLLGHDLADPDAVDEALERQVERRAVSENVVIFFLLRLLLLGELGVRVAPPGEDAVVGVVPLEEGGPDLRRRRGRREEEEG